MILHLATFWGDMNPDVRAVVDRPDSRTQRAIVAQAMARLLGEPAAEQ